MLTTTIIIILFMALYIIGLIKEMKDQNEKYKLIMALGNTKEILLNGVIDILKKDLEQSQKVNRMIKDALAVEGLGVKECQRKRPLPTTTSYATVGLTDPGASITEEPYFKIVKLEKK